MNFLKNENIVSSDEIKSVLALLLEVYARTQ